MRSSGPGAVLIGAAAMLLLLAGVVAIVALGGFYPVAASNGDPPLIGWLLEESMEHGVKKAAKRLAAPKLSAADIREGGSHFKGMCQQCHGGPGAEREDFASAMNPRPPDLAKVADDWSEAEIFWIARNGIKMSGMPAFGKADEDGELWKIAGFVKQLNAVSAKDYAALPNAHEHEAEGGHHRH
jgi:mono/diheme cytochrome c family protein